MTTDGAGHDQNQELIKQAVQRMVWALSKTQDQDELDDQGVAVAVAIAWRADHDTGEGTLTDDELARDSTLLLPYIPLLRSSSVIRQQQVWEEFLIDHPSNLNPGSGIEEPSEMTEEVDAIAALKTMEGHDLRELVRITDTGEVGGLTALGWTAMAKMLREEGHDVEVCNCKRCPQTRRFMGTIYYFRCHLCGAHEEAPYIKAGDLLHCEQCHRKRCFPSGPKCWGGPVGER